MRHRSRTTRPDLGLLQACLPSYRDDFVTELLGRRPGTLLYCGDSHFDRTVTPSPAIAAQSLLLKNRFFAGRRLLWERGAVRAGIGPRSVVLEFNPRIINVWVTLAIRRLLQRRSILWGHAWPRAGVTARTAFIRHLMAQLADGILVYTAQDRDQLAPLVRCRVWVAPNAVCSRRANNIVPGRAKNIIQIGRLVEAKRPLLTVEAWALVCDRLPGSQLVFVGTGPLKAEVMRVAGVMGIEERVSVLGHVSDPSKLAVLFADSFLSVSAGYAGLSLTQGFAHGVPALIADDEPHAPEIAVATEMNSRTFRALDPADMAREIMAIFQERDRWMLRRAQISAATLDEYSVETMVDGFLSAACPSPAHALRHDPARGVG